MLTNKLSKIVAKNDLLHVLGKFLQHIYSYSYIDKNAHDVDMEPRSSMFFKIAIPPNAEFPIKLLIQNLYNNDIMLYWSRSNKRPDEENHNGMIFLLLILTK